MSDHVASPYAPREFDCTGEPRHWPCGTGFEAPASVQYESVAVAARRLGIGEESLHNAAKNRGMLASAQRGRPQRGGGGGKLLPASTWDEVRGLMRTRRRPS